MNAYNHHQLYKEQHSNFQVRKCQALTLKLKFHILEVLW